jgi:hypothetical protein
MFVYTFGLRRPVIVFILFAIRLARRSTPALAHRPLDIGTNTAMPLHRHPLARTDQPAAARQAAIHKPPAAVVAAPWPRPVIGARQAVIQGYFVGVPVSGVGATIQRRGVDDVAGWVGALPRSGGARLPDALQRKMESCFQADFSDVRFMSRRRRRRWEPWLSPWARMFVSRPASTSRKRRAASSSSDMSLLT